MNFIALAVAVDVLTELGVAMPVPLTSVTIGFREAVLPALPQQP
jgi:hypothetical protein